MWLKVRDAVSLLLLVVLVPGSSGNSAGAPGDLPGGQKPEVCRTLMPGHNNLPAQTTPAPFEITFSPSTFAAGGSNVTVTLTTTGSNNFMGFLLTARYADICVDQTLQPGTFTSITNTTLTCGGEAITHSTRNSQNSLSFQWTPPANSLGHIQFRATFVKLFNTFWVAVPSSDILADSSLGTPDPSTLQGPCASTTSAPTTTTPTPTGRITKDAACGQTKGCYSDCSGTDCNYLMTWEPGTSADNVRITMRALVSSQFGRYIAFGLSNDDVMGSDSVNYCVNADADEGVNNAFNNGKLTQRQLDPRNGLSDISVSYDDGVLTCSFLRLRAGDGNQRYPLDQTYTVFWAEGSGNPAGIGKHDSLPSISTSAVRLTDYTVDIGGDTSFPLIKAHGSLMMIAWIFASSIGIVFARYFKNVWSEKSWFGQKVWFQIHRTCMVIVLLSTVTAFIIIFVEVGGYSEIQGKGYEEAHPILGIIVTGLTVINPVMALFRPHPGTENRPIFNWAHWGVGTTAHILGVITIFFGVSLDKSGAPDYTIYILAAFVAWQVLVQLLLELFQYLGRNAVAEVTPPINRATAGNMNGEARSNAYEMSDLNSAGPSSKPPPQKEESFNKVLLVALHVLVVSGFTLALIIVLNIGEED